MENKTLENRTERVGENENESSRERRTHHRKSEPSEGERDWKGERESRERNGRWGRSEVRAREEVRSLREKSR